MCPRPLYAGPAAAHPYACGAQRALLPIAVNINDVRESVAIFPRPCKLTFDLLTLKMVSESRMGYLCVNFGLPRPLCSRLRPDVRDRQTDVRRASLNASALWGWSIIKKW